MKRHSRSASERESRLFLAEFLSGLRLVENPQNLNFFLPNPVGDCQGQSRNHEFPGPFNPAGFSQRRLISEKGNDFKDSLGNRLRGPRIVAPDKFPEFGEILNRLGIPNYFHFGVVASSSVPQVSSQLIISS
jgi:hypothetical protein